MGFRRRKLEAENEVYEYAVRCLAARMRSIAELKRLLRQRVDLETGSGSAWVELVIRRLRDQGYLNDRKYAAAYSSFRRDNEKLGPRRIAWDLKARGVAREIIAKTLDSTFEEVDEEKQAREYLRRKRATKPRDPKQARRIFRQLLHAGFEAKTIFAILRKWDVEEETLEALEGSLQQ